MMKEKAQEAPYRSAPYRAEMVQKPFRTWRRGLSNLAAGSIVVGAVVAFVCVFIHVMHDVSDSHSGSVVIAGLMYAAMAWVGLHAVLSDIKKKEDKWLVAHRNTAVIAAAAWPLFLVIAFGYGVVEGVLWLTRLVALLSRTFARWVRYGVAPKSPNGGA